MSATPRPWRVEANRQSRGTPVIRWGDQAIFGAKTALAGSSEEDAALIVSAVNAYEAHERAVEALREIKARLWRKWGPGDVRCCLLCASDEDQPHRERCPIRSVDAALAAVDAARGVKP